MKSAWVWTTVLASLVSASAYAAGWDFDEEYESREWRSISLYWARAIHPDEPQTGWISENIDPPPREMWCIPQSGYEDEPADCEVYDDLMDDWLRYYLELGPNDPIPDPLDAPWPPECSSACFPE